MTFKYENPSESDTKRINTKRRCAICGDYYAEEDRSKHINCVYEYQRFDKI